MATSWRAIGGKCRALMMAAKSSAAAATTTAATKAAKPAKSASAGTLPKGFAKSIPVTSQLGEFVGSNESTRNEAVKKIWEYIKLHQLQNPSNKKEIVCDQKLKTLFGKDKVGFLEVGKLLSQHFVKSG